MVRWEYEWPAPWTTAGTTGTWVIEEVTPRYIPQNSGVIEAPKGEQKMSSKNEPVPSYHETWLKFLRDSTGLDINKRSTPFYKVLNSRDGYADHYGHSLRFPEGKLRCRMWDIATGAGATAIKDNDGYIFAYIFDRGVQLMVDPETVAWADEAPEGETRRHPAFAVLGPIEEFFKTWNERFPERLADGFMVMRKERLRVLEKRRVKNITRIMAYKKDLRALESGQVETRRAHKVALDMTRERFLESAREWLASPPGMTLVDHFDMKDKETILHTKSFVVEGVNLGPYKIALSHTDLHVNVTATANISHRGYCHPHVSGGDICWGSDVSYYKRIQNTLNPVEILIAVADFLHTGYSEGGAYHKLYSWRADNDGGGFYDCDYCANEGLQPNRHPDDENCPQYCSECENYILSMAWHRNCWDHGCYNIVDGADDVCPTCRSIEEENARARQREREAEAEVERARVRMAANIGRSVIIRNSDETGVGEDGDELEITDLVRDDDDDWDYMLDNGSQISESWFDEGWVDWVEIAEEPADVPTDDPAPAAISNVGRMIRVINADVADIDCSDGYDFLVSRDAEPDANVWLEVLDGEYFINPDWFREGVVEWVESDEAWAARDSAPAAEASPDTHGEHNVGRTIRVVNFEGTSLGRIAQGGRFEVTGMRSMGADGADWYQTSEWIIDPAWFENGLVEWVEDESVAAPVPTHGSHNIGRRLRILENDALLQGPGVDGERRVFEIMGAYSEDDETVYRVAQDGSSFTEGDDWVIRQRWFENGSVEWVTPEPAAEENIGREIRILRPEAAGALCDVGTTLRVISYDGDQHYYRAQDSALMGYVINESAFEALNVEWVANAGDELPAAPAPTTPPTELHGAHNVGRRIRVINAHDAGVPCTNGDEFHIVDWTEDSQMYTAPVDGGSVDNGSNWGILPSSLDSGDVEWLSPAEETETPDVTPASADERAVLQDLIDREVYRVDCACEQCLRIRELGMAPPPPEDGQEDGDLDDELLALAGADEVSNTESIEAPPEEALAADLDDAGEPDADEDNEEESAAE